MHSPTTVPKPCRSEFPPSFKTFIEQHFKDIHDLIDDLGARDWYVEEARDRAQPQGRSDDDHYVIVATRDLQQRYSEMIRRYEAFQYPLFVYRSLCLTSIDAFRPLEAGVSWTFDIESPQPYWGAGKGQDFLLKAAVQKAQIDWKTTMVLHLNPIHGEEENEARLVSGASVEWLGYHDGDSDDMYVDAEWIPPLQKTITI